MQSFSFHTTGSILSEVGATAQIGEIAANAGCRKVAFITDKMIVELGLAEAALRSLVPMLAEDAMKQTRLLVNNPREMTLEAAQAIYERAL